MGKILGFVGKEGNSFLGSEAEVLHGSEDEKLEEGAGLANLWILLNSLKIDAIYVWKGMYVRFAFLSGTFSARG